MLINFTKYTTLVGDIGSGGGYACRDQGYMGSYCAFLSIFCEPRISLKIIVKISIFNLSENKIFLSITLKTETTKKDQRILLYKIKISLIESWKIFNVYDKAYEILIASKFKITQII